MTMRQQPVGRFTVTPQFVNAKRLAKLRDGLRVGVPITVTFTPDQPSDHPAIELDVDEHSGSLVITRVTLTATPERPIRSDAVRVYSLSKLAAIAAKTTAIPAVGRQGFEEGEKWPPSNKRVMESIVGATRSRTNIDRGRLEDVARYYEVGGVFAVEDGLHISRSQAYRLIKLARAEGHIEGVGS